MSAQRISQQLRLLFCNYFKNHGHQFVEPCPVIRRNDPTLEFTNAGMNQFKDIFLSRDENLSHLTRACNYQKCVRLCDLDAVGRDFRHHTFFEMLGNWSFNDYYKEEACYYAWQFLVKELNLDTSKIFATYHKADKETHGFWVKLGLPHARVLPNDSGDNFWEMGTVGPCGMSTEIFVRQDDDEEPLEIWNLVFIDQERIEGGGLVTLKKRFVDTGMGLERITAIKTGVKSNYDTDLFMPLFDVIQRKSNLDHYSGSLENSLDTAYRILADHARMITIVMSEPGSKPGGKGAKFHLRNVIRRALKVSQEDFKQERPRFLLFDLVDEVVDSLSCAYPGISEKSNVSNIRRMLRYEEMTLLR